MRSSVPGNGPETSTWSSVRSKSPASRPICALGVAVGDLSMWLISPPKLALAPYRAVAGPRTTSMRSIAYPSIAVVPKKRVPFTRKPEIGLARRRMRSKP